MLSLSPRWTNTTNHGHQYHNHDQSQKETMERFAATVLADNDFCKGNSLLDSIDFDDLFLQMDSELLAEFSTTSYEPNILNASTDRKLCTHSKTERDEISTSRNNSEQSSALISRGEEVVGEGEDSVVVHQIRKEDDNVVKEKKLTGQCKNNAKEKRKVKVAWTPELHRRFVEVVEQLGVDKAVPSRILELMGIDCLTRHNIASHLQKYRSHRKHLLAGEAAAASWSQRPLMYGAVPVVAEVPAALGFPSMSPPPITNFVPLHVWGHPAMEPSRFNMWLKHHRSPSTPPPAWHPAAPPHHPMYNRSNSIQVSNAGTHCFPPPLLSSRVGAQAMYKIKPSYLTGPYPLVLHPQSNESLDAAIDDVLSKPWLPMPLGLKSPSVDGVMGELHRQGVANIPPSCA